MTRSRLFFISYAAANGSLVLYGLLALLMPAILLEPFSEHVYQFPADATRAVTYLAALFRLLGFFNILLGALGLLILRRYQVTGRRWHLKVVIVFTVLAYVGPVVFDNTVGSIGFFEILEHILFAAVVVFGLVMWRQGEAV